MNNTVLKIIAGLLAIGAIVVALIGIRLSQQPAATAPASSVAPASVPTETVVVAARLIKAGKPVGAADVILKSIQAPAPQSYRQTQDLLGKIALMDLQPGTPLQPAQFMSDSLASQLREGERAVAVFADEVVALGGYARPGDHVDVLSYSSRDDTLRTQAYAQVTVENARILTIGDISQMDVDRSRNIAADGANQGGGTTNQETAKIGPQNQAELAVFRRELHSAVLAVPESEVARLMFAANSGSLRLALRPYAESQMAANKQPNRQTVTRAEMAPTSLLIPTLASRFPNTVTIQEGSVERSLNKEQ